MKYKNYVDILKHEVRKNMKNFKKKFYKFKGCYENEKDKKSHTKVFMGDNEDVMI